MIWGHSPVLGLDLCWDNGELRLRDPHTGEYLPTPEQTAARAGHAEAQRDLAQAERDTALSRAAEIEAENARLREMLQRLEED